MLKPAAIAIAILFCRPTLSAATATAYAAIVHARAMELEVDPLMIVAIVDHESRWVEAAVSKDHEDFGLGQLRARYRPACVKDQNPVWAPSPACAAEKKRLLDGAYNLGAVGWAIATWRATCKQKTGSAGELQWLTAYAGLNRPKLGRWCGMQATSGGKWAPRPVPTVVLEFLRRRLALRRYVDPLIAGGRGGT